MFGSLMMFASGVFASSPSSARSSFCRFAASSVSEKFAMIRPASEMSRVSTEMPAEPVNASMIGSSECVARGRCFVGDGVNDFRGTHTCPFFAVDPLFPVNDKLRPAAPEYVLCEHAVNVSALAAVGNEKPGRIFARKFRCSAWTRLSQCRLRNKRGISGRPLSGLCRGAGAGQSEHPCSGTL